jgi:hypothetical protein
MQALHTSQSSSITLLQRVSKQHNLGNQASLHSCTLLYNTTPQRWYQASESLAQQVQCKSPQCRAASTWPRHHPARHTIHCTSEHSAVAHSGSTHWQHTPVRILAAGRQHESVIPHLSSVKSDAQNPALLSATSSKTACLEPRLCVVSCAGG